MEMNEVPEFISQDTSGVWRTHKNMKSVTATNSSRYAGAIARLFKLDIEKLEEVEYGKKS